MAKIARDVMAKRIEAARNFFLKNPNATVAELNDMFARRGEKKMGAKAYEVRVEARRLAQKGAKPREEKGTHLIAPSQEADAKLAQEVLGILDGLAKRIAGSHITGIYFNAKAGEVPVAKLMELVPQERTVELGHGTNGGGRATLRAPEPQAQPTPPPPTFQTPAPQPSNVTPIGSGNPPTQQ